MPVTVNHALTATTPDNPSYEIKPSAWNASHVGTIALVGSEVLPAFADSPSVTFGLSNGSVTASAIGGGGGGGNLAVSAGSTTGIFTGITFSNSNGLSWGLNAGTITASYTNITQSNQTDGYYITGNSVLSTFGTVDARSLTVSGAGLVSIGMSNGSLVISGAGGTGSGIGLSAGASSISNGVVTFSNSNGVTFGLNAGVLTATVNPGPAAGIAAGADGAGHTQTTGSLVFSNSNGLTFGVSTGAGAGTITGSYTVPSVAGLISNINLSAGTTSGNLSAVTFSNSNGVSWGLNAGTVTASVAAVPVAVSGSNGSFAFSTVTFGNLNGLSHYTSNGSMVASYTVPVQSVQTIGLFGLSNTTQNTSATVDARSMTFAGAGIISVGMTNGSVVISSPASTGISQSIYATSNTTQSSSGTSPIGSLLVAGAGNVSVGFSNGSMVISGATAAGLTQGSLYGLGNTTQNSSTVLAFSALSFNGLGAQTVGFSNGSIQLSVPVTSSLSATGNASLSVNASTISIGANAAAVSIGGNSTSAGAGYSNISTGTAVLMGGPNITLSQNGATISISGGAGGGGGWQLSAGASSQSTGTIVFSNSNGISFGLSTAAAAAGTVTASYTVPTVPTLSHGVSTGGNTVGNTGTYSGQLVFAGGNNITLSVSSGAAGAQTITISGANAGGAQTGISGIIVSNTTYTSGTVSFSNANGISFGSSAGQAITASYTVPTQTAQTVGIYASSQTTASASSYTFDARSLSVIGAGGISIGLNSTSAGGTTTGFIISAPAVSSLSNSNNVSFGTNGSTITASYALNVSAGGGTSNALSAITFSNSNNFTFGLSTGAGVGTLTASFSNANLAGTATAITGKALITLNSNGLSFNGTSLAGTGTSIGTTTGSMSMALNSTGLTIAQPTLTRFVVNGEDQLQPIAAPVNASATFVYVPVYAPVTGTRIDALLSMSCASAATTATGALVFSAYAVIYTRNANSLSSLSSGSTQTTYTYASNTGGATGLIGGAIRPMSVPVNFNLPAGEYFVGFNMVTNTSSIGLSTTNYGVTFSMMGVTGVQSAQNYAEITAATATSSGLYFGAGVYSAASTGLPAAVSISGINATGTAAAQANIALVFRNA